MSEKPQAPERTGDRKLSERSFPSRFGRYVLMDRLAAGGMAEVFRAKAESDGNRVIAIKCMLPALADDEEFAGMFVDEAKLAAQLQHPNIVQIYELGRHGEQLYIAMELIHGRDLRAIVRKAKRTGKKLPPQFVAYVIAKAAEALDYAHSKKSIDGKPLKLVHRDVSPQNILVGYDGNIKVVDFGIAKADQRRTVSRVGILKGKFAYMAPEQVKTGEVDGRTDIFALGAVLYETFAGRKLFYGESDFSILERVTNGTMPDDPAAWEKIPPEIAKVVRRCVTVEPKDRFQEAQLMAAALEPLLIEERSFYGQKQAREYMLEMFGAEIAENEQILRSFAAINVDIPEPEKEERREPEPIEVLDKKDWSIVTKEPKKTDERDQAAADGDMSRADVPFEGTQVEKVDDSRVGSGTAIGEPSWKASERDDTRRGGDEETRVMEVGTSPGAKDGAPGTRSRSSSDGERRGDTRPVAAIPTARPVAPKPYLLWGVSGGVALFLAILVIVGIVHRARELREAHAEAEAALAEAKGLSKPNSNDRIEVVKQVGEQAGTAQPVVAPEPARPSPTITTTPLDQDETAVAEPTPAPQPGAMGKELSDMIAEKPAEQTAPATKAVASSSSSAASSRVGYITVKTTDGRAAKVFVDKKELGSTPLIGRAVGFGAHTIRVVDKAEHAKSVQVTVTSSHSKKAPLDLTVGL